jgi:hypothetical protein
MALRDLKSSLKNLRFDKDTPGGGSSGLPYIKGGVPESTPGGKELADLARFSSDGNIRGGLFSIVSSTTDTIRISRFLNDFPKGLLFTSKQVGLAKSNPKIETGTRGDVLNTQVYNLNSNLLAQVALQGSGEHIPYYGFNTNNLRNDENKYEKIVSSKTTNENRLVTLYNNKIIGADAINLPDNLDKLGISDSNSTITANSKIKSNGLLFDYAGGPGSLYGDGDTIIPRVTNTVDTYDQYVNNPLSFTKSDYRPIFKVLSEENPYNSSYIASLYNNSNVDAFIQSAILESQFGIPNNTQAINTIRDDFNLEDATFYQQSSPDFIRPENVPVGISLINQFGNTMGYSALLASKEYPGEGELQDFRQKTIISNPLASDYSNDKVKISTRIGIGDPGARTDRSSLNTIYNGGQDKVNMIPLYTDATNPFENTKYKDEARDIIKFAFETIDNDSPEKTTKIHFRAFITNFSDNIGAEWNGTKYMGRGENFYTYQGFTRDVSFNLKVAAQSKQEMLVLYQKLNYLASSLLPDYNGDGFMRGNLHKLTVGEWFYRTPGILKSMNVSIDDNYPWEIKFTEPENENNPQTGVDYGGDYFPNANKYNGSSDFQESNSDADQMELPQIIDIQFTFTPILNELPALSKYDPDGGRIDKRGILISNDVGRTENFINRITTDRFPAPSPTIDRDTPINVSVD